MNRLCIGVSVVVFSTLGWYAGAYFGPVTGYILSSIGSLFGVYVGWRLARDYF